MQQLRLKINCLRTFQSYTTIARVYPVPPSSRPTNVTNCNLRQPARWQRFALCRRLRTRMEWFETSRNGPKLNVVQKLAKRSPARRTLPRPPRTCILKTVQPRVYESLLQIVGTHRSVPPVTGEHSVSRVLRGEGSNCGCSALARMTLEGCGEQRAFVLRKPSAIEVPLFRDAIVLPTHSLRGDVCARAESRRTRAAPGNALDVASAVNGPSP